MSNDLNANESESKKAWPFIIGYIAVVLLLFAMFVALVLLMTGIINV